MDSSPPTITGTTTQGQTLTEAHGTWSNSPTSYTYHWQDCDNTGNNCSPITNNATSQTYTLTTNDVGHTIKVQETASNAGGPGTPALSTATAVITPPAPVDSSPPTITGTTTQGQTLTEAHGTWSNSPTSYTYHWQDCDNTGNNCSPITNNATSQTYTLTTNDVGHTIKVQETASNAGGPGTPALSTATAVVNPPGPSLTASPSSVSGRGSVTVSWSGVASPTASDWVGLYHPGDPNTAYIDYFWTDSCTRSAGSGALASGSCTYLMPSTPGTYELRLLSNNGYVVLATSSTVTVTGTSASLTASPGSISSGQSVTVTWSGVASPTTSDWVGLYHPGDPNTAYIDCFWTDSCTRTTGSAAPASGSCTYTMPAVREPTSCACSQTTATPSSQPPTPSPSPARLRA